MRAQSQICFLFFVSLFSFGQKIEETDLSGYKHNYVVSKLQFIEDASDTARLNYIAEVKFSDVQTNYLIIASWLDAIKIKAKSLGANAYLVHSFFEDENSVVLTLHFYFAGEKFLKANKLKRDTNSVFVFNQTRFTGDSGYFYLDLKRVAFDPIKSYKFNATRGKPRYISTNTSHETAETIFYTKPKPSRFFVIPANKRNFTVGGDRYAPVHPITIGFTINGVPVTFRSNSPYELKYEVGCLLKAAYK
jgi:hypothetical protein